MTIADETREQSAILLAQKFHETYERLAPDFGYKTPEESAVPWDKVPEQNRLLMIAVADQIIASATIEVLDSVIHDLNEMRNLMAEGGA